MHVATTFVHGFTTFAHGFINQKVQATKQELLLNACLFSLLLFAVIWTLPPVEWMAKVNPEYLPFMIAVLGCLISALIIYPLWTTTVAYAFVAFICNTVLPALLLLKAIRQEKPILLVIVLSFFFLSKDLLIRRQFLRKTEVKIFMNVLWLVVYYYVAFIDSQSLVGGSIFHRCCRLLFDIYVAIHANSSHVAWLYTAYTENMQNVQQLAFAFIRGVIGGRNPLPGQSEVIVFVLMRIIFLLVLLSEIYERLYFDKLDSVSIVAGVLILCILCTAYIGITANHKVDQLYVLTGALVFLDARDQVLRPFQTAASFFNSISSYIATPRVPVNGTPHAQVLVAPQAANPTPIALNAQQQPIALNAQQQPVAPNAQQQPHQFTDIPEVPLFPSPPALVPLHTLYQAKNLDNVLNDLLQDVFIAFFGTANAGKSSAIRSFIRHFQGCDEHYDSIPILNESGVTTAPCFFQLQSLSALTGNPQVAGRVFLVDTPGHGFDKNRVAGRPSDFFHEMKNWFTRLSTSVGVCVFVINAALHDIEADFFYDCIKLFLFINGSDGWEKIFFLYNPHNVRETKLARETCLNQWKKEIAKRFVPEANEAFGQFKEKIGSRIFRVNFSCQDRTLNLDEMKALIESKEMDEPASPNLLRQILACVEKKYPEIHAAQAAKNQSLAELLPNVLAGGVAAAGAGGATAVATFQIGAANVAYFGPVVAYQLGTCALGSILLGPALIVGGVACGASVIGYKWWSKRSKQLSPAPVVPPPTQAVHSAQFVRDHVDYLAPFRA